MTVVTAIQSGNWSSESTWDTNTVPSTLDTVIIDAAYTVIYDISTPISSDVRSGVATGTTTGSLIVPQNATVLSGVVYDNGTTGTLSVASQLSVDGIALDVTAIKAQTDQINFKTISVTEYTGDQYWVNVSLLLHMNGSDLSTIFTDEAGHTVSVYGDAKITTSNSKYGGSSGTFDGSGDYVGITADSSLNLVSGDWTIETWIYIPALPSSNMYIYDKDGVSGSSYPQYSSSITSAGKISTFLGNGNGVSPSGQNFLSNGTISINTWTHLAWVRSGNNLILFIDGIQDYLAAITATMHEGNKPFYIGFSTGQPSTSNLKGLIDDFRITKGVARYISNFTPPSEELAGAGTNNTYDQTRVIAYGTGGTGGTCDLTAVESSLSTISSSVTAVKTKTDQLTFDTVSVTEYLGGDPSWDSVSLLLHGNGTNGSRTIVDEAGRIGTVFGNTQISTTKSKHGGASIKFDGTGDYISYNGTGLVDFGTSDFTIEFWIFPSVTTNGMLILDARPSGSQNAQVTVAMDYNGTGKINWYTSSAFKINSASSISTGVWSHIAFSRASGKLRLFINGVLDSSVADNTTYVSNTNVFVGANSYSPGSDSFNGYLDDLRVTHGVARYIGSFTPPAAELPGRGTSITYDQSQVVASGTSGGGTCDLTTVNNTLSIINGNVVSNGTNINAIKAKTDQITFTASGVVADAGTTSGSGTVDLSPITSAISAVDGKVTSIKTKTDELSFSSGKVIADASAVDYTSQLSAITSTVNAISDAVDLIDAVTSKIAFEAVYSEGDPNLAQVIFKAEFNGTNGSTTINADTGQIGTNQGSPSLNTAYTRTGTSSVALSSSIVSYGNISSLNLGANDFTIEFSVNFSSIVSTAGDYAGVVGKRASNGDFSWICYVTEGKMNFLTSGTNAVSIAHPTTLSPATWYDVAISRTGDILKFYVNGVLSQVSCTGMNMTTTTAPFFIGRFSYDISSYHMFGYLDRLRITVGTGRYNSVAPVSPPVSEYPTTLNGIAQSYKVVANCDSGTTIPTDLTNRLTDLRNRINAIHFIVKDE